MNKLDIIYYLGVLTLVSAVVTIMITKFREYEHIDLKDHIVMITIYIILLIFSIILWKLFIDFLFGFEDIINQDNQSLQRMING